jgi:hypothetical protein
MHGVRWSADAEVTLNRLRAEITAIERTFPELAQGRRAIRRTQPRRPIALRANAAKPTNATRQLSTFDVMRLGYAPSGVVVEALN